jgi:plasmid replication initiation protein
MKNNIIRKSNQIIEACYNLTIPELRLIYSCISKIEYKQLIDKNDLFHITRDEYSTTFNVDKSNSTKELKKAVDKLWDRDIIIKRENDKPLKSRWITGQAIYENGDAQIRFAVDVIPYLTTLLELGNFTKYQIENIGELSSPYSIRIYELLKQYERLKKRTITLTELRETLCLGTKYKVMCDLKKRVIDFSIKEINAHTDLQITYENVKTRNTITAFTFFIRSKNVNKAAVKDNRKYLTPEQVDSKGKPGESYPDLYSRLEKEGYVFTKTHRF